MKLADISHETKDALRMCDSFIDALAVATWATEDALDMTIEYLTSVKGREDNATVRVIDVFLEYLRAHARGEL